MEDTENCTIPYHKKHVLFTEFTLNLHGLTIEFTRFCHKIYMLYSQNLQDFDTEFIIWITNKAINLAKIKHNAS